MYLEVSVGRHPLERADDVKRAAAGVHHLRLRAVPETHDIAICASRTDRCIIRRYFLPLRDDSPRFGRKIRGTKRGRIRGTSHPRVTRVRYREEGKYEERTFRYRYIYKPRTPSIRRFQLAFRLNVFVLTLAGTRAHALTLDTFTLRRGSEG